MSCSIVCALCMNCQEDMALFTAHIHVSYDDKAVLHNIVN